MENNKIELFGKEWIIKKSMSSFLLFEELTKKPISEFNGTLSDTLTMFYCILKSKNPEFTYSFSDFIDLIDEEIEAVQKFNEFIEKENEKIPNDAKAKKKITKK